MAPHDRLLPLRVSTTAPRGRSISVAVPPTIYHLQVMTDNENNRRQKKYTGKGPIIGLHCTESPSHLGQSWLAESTPAKDRGYQNLSESFAIWPRGIAARSAGRPAFGAMRGRRWCMSTIASALRSFQRLCRTVPLAPRSVCWRTLHVGISTYDAWH